MVLSLDRWAGKVAIVTGASSGIGAATAEKLVEEGLQVAALARRLDRLDELAKKLSGKKGKLFPIKTDMTKEEDILSAFKWVKSNLGPVHILINNAGALTHGLLTEAPTEDLNKIIQLNVIGLAIATREAVQDMRANNVNGHIININSIVGHQVQNLPFNIYPASKFAARALAETLRLELNSLKLKIKITNLSPGLVNTDPIPAEWKTKESLEDGKIIEPEQIANAVLYVLSTPPHVQIQELIIRPIAD